MVCHVNVWFLVKKRSIILITWPGTWNGKTHFQNIKRTVGCIGDTFAAQASCDRIAEYIQDEYSGQPSEHTLNPLCVSYTGWLWCVGNHLPLSWPTTSKRTQCCNRRNTSVLRRLQHCVREKGSVKFRSPTDCVELYNRNCGTRTVENLTPYRMKSGTVPTKGFRSTSWRSVCGALPFAHVSLYVCKFMTGFICTMRLSCFLRSSLPTCEACVVHEAVFNVWNRRLRVG